jgi:3-phenylpropionate/trans-cinnamate dioxygenase ferredoxin reductase subunit
MNAPHVKYLLVGGGLAASSAAEAIRAIDRAGTILLVGQEINRPYHRPPLSKEFLRRDKGRAELWAKPIGWYEENEVHLRTGRQVAHLDCARRAVTLSSGEVISFDRLLLATGAAPKPLDAPGAELPNVFYLRTIEDVGRLQHAIDKSKLDGRKRATVIGGGVLGVELAASLTQTGLTIDLVASREPWGKFAGESTGKFVARYLESNGVTVHTGQRPQRLEGDGRVQRVVMPSGEAIPCDFVVAAAGIVINRDLLRGTPISAERAILADDHCRTSVEHVYAAGDCAAVFDPLFGKHRLLDHWDNAQVTGKIAGTNMAGGEARYDVVNYFFSDVFDLSLSAWGEARQVSHRLTRGTPSVESPEMVEIGIAADGRIAQVLALNHRGQDEVLRELVKRRVYVEGKEEALKDPTRTLVELLS